MKIEYDQIEHHEIGYLNANHSLFTLRTINHKNKEIKKTLVFKYIGPEDRANVYEIEIHDFGNENIIIEYMLYIRDENSSIPKYINRKLNSDELCHYFLSFGNDNT